MCRIAGILDFNNSLGDSLEPKLLKMRDSMAHGGPNDSGIYISDDKKIAFAHRRLSIIDLSALGHQPMSNKDKSIWITYNGEIYNFKELRAELINTGCDFVSKTDTEVLVYGYEKWGIEKLLSKLRGMFAFAIYDDKRKKTILARDRFGIKPLYYYKDDEKFIFSSEVKGILRSGLVPDVKEEKALTAFLILGSIPSPLTSIKDVLSLPAYHYMEIEKDKLKIQKYWDLERCFQNKTKISFPDAAEEVKSLMKEAVGLHLISDAPLGIFLSGGIDSSSLVAYASKAGKTLETLSIVFEEEEYSEESYEKAVSARFKTNHKSFLVREDHFRNDFENIFNAMDEPTTDGVNTYFISKAAKESGLTVVLSGVGGDEVFLGYSHYKKNMLLNLLLKTPKFLRNKLRLINPRFQKTDFLDMNESFSTPLLFRGLFTPYQVSKLLDKNICNDFMESDYGLESESLVDGLDYFDFKHYLGNQILKDCDFMSMKHSLEIRIPYLDHVLVEKILSYPNDIKFSNEMNKPLLVEGLKNILPKEVYSRNKVGFTFPFDKWLKKEASFYKEVSLRSKFLNRDAVNKTWEKFLKGEVHWSRVWSLVVAGRKF